jgi:flagellar motor switch/type III secretory pathway protein FliN
VQGRPMWLIRATIDSITVVGRVETKMDDKKMGIEFTQQNKTDLESLEIDLEFKAGSLKIPLAELKSVQEGYVFELKPNLHTNYITIHANGRPIARGVFVNMGKRLGVRVIELLFTKD